LFGLLVATPKRGHHAMYKVEKLAEGSTTVFRLVGRINARHLDELSRLIADVKATPKLDLAEVTLVDVDVVRFLGNKEREGVELANCSRFVREWIEREQTINAGQEK
jgi:hypothetical protein